MNILASDVKKLRELTQAGMMACRKALEEAEGDIDQAKQLLREKGAAQAAKKADRAASEGLVASYIEGSTAALAILCCETDFVARNENFVSFSEKLSQIAAIKGISSPDVLREVTLDNGKTIEETRHELIAQLGENIQLGQVVSIAGKGQLATYKHGNKIAVLVDYTGGDEALGRDLAMHIAASHPYALSREDLDATLLETEEAIIRKQLAESEKPPEILEKIVAGKLNSYAKERVLLDQEFVKDPALTISQLLEQQGAKIHSFVRLQVGESEEV